MYTKFIAGIATAVVLSAGAASAATTYSFENISGGDTYGDAYASFFSMTVSDLGSNSVLFQISSEATTPAQSYFIGSVYIDDYDASPYLSNKPAGSSDTYSGLTSDLTQGNVSYSYKSGGNANLPQGNNLSPVWDGELQYDADNGAGNAKAVQQGETVGFIFTGNYDDIIEALDDGYLRIGFHLQGLANGKSDSFISGDQPGGPTPVPLPAGGLLLLTGLGGIALMRRRAKA